MAAFKVSLFLSLVVSVAEAFPKSITAIPNGSRVPNPYLPGFTWAAVGHLNPDGGGPLNVFGQAFKDAGYKWTRQLCLSDSDGDGRTNGQELGDPKCTLSLANTDGRITHPGIPD